jgi:hypothetical protein
MRWPGGAACAGERIWPGLSNRLQTPVAGRIVENEDLVNVLRLPGEGYTFASAAPSVPVRTAGILEVPAVAYNTAYFGAHPDLMAAAARPSAVDHLS